MSQTITDTARYSFHVTWSPRTPSSSPRASSFLRCRGWPVLPRKRSLGSGSSSMRSLMTCAPMTNLYLSPVHPALLREVPTPTWRGPASTTRDRGCGAAPQLEPVRHAQTGRLLNVRSVTRPERNSRASRSHFSRWLRRQDGDPTYYPRFNFTDR